MRSVLPSWILLCLLTASWVVSTGSNASAQESTSPAVDAPLVVLHATGVDRLMQRVELMFSNADRTEMAERTKEFVKTTMFDLEGMDRARPFGLMLYLKPGLSGMSGVAYVPVKDWDKLMNTLSLGSGDFHQTEDKKDRYSITNSSGQIYFARQRDGYAFVVSEADEDELDRNFPSPEKMVSRLNSRHDVAVSLLIKNVPPATRQIFVTFLQTQTMAELQRKDDEPEAAYRVRKANGENALELIEKIVTQGEELTLGGRIDEQTGVGEIDLEVAGTTDSKLAKFFQGMTGRRSLFSNLLQQPSMMTLAMSWQLDEKQRKAFTELLTYGPEEIERRAADEGVEDTKSVVKPLFDTLLRSAESGHLDGFLQLAGEGEGGHSMIAGVRVMDGANFPKQFHDALKFTQSKFDQNDRVASMELDVEKIDGFPLHRIPLTPPDKPGQWMFGESSHLYAYATTQALWIAFGGEEALTTLKSSVEAAKKPAMPGEDRKPRVPFVFQTRAKSWVTVQTEAGVDESPAAPSNRPRRSAIAAANAVQFREEVKSAFDDQNDGLRMEVRPTDSGARVRFEFQRGWVGLLGRVIALQVERTTSPRAEAAPDATATPTPVEN